MAFRIGVGAAVFAGAFSIAAMAQPAIAQEDLAEAVMAADAAAGQGISFQCIGCHTFGDGEGARVGPGLFDIVGRTIGGVEGFAYSEAFVALAEAGETWTLEMLDAFLADPATAIPDNAMAYSGVRTDADRLNLLAYLASLTPEM